MTNYDLPNGRLTLTINRADLPPDELFALGARANPRRAFLFVSKVLGKHWPVATATLARIHALLAAKLPAELPTPVLFIGMAETATALAQGRVRGVAGACAAGRGALSAQQPPARRRGGNAAL